MPKRRSERAKRRIAQRTRANALALETAAVAEQERPRKLKRARHCTKLEFSNSVARSLPSSAAPASGLARDFAIAGGMPKVTASYEPSAGPPQRRIFIFNGQDGPRQIDARRRFEIALQAAGAQLSTFLMHVAVLDQPLSDWSRPGMHNGDGAALLRLALDILGEHYRRPDDDGVASSYGGLRHLA